MNVAWPPALADMSQDVAGACAEALAGARVAAIRPAPGGHSGFTYLLELDREPGLAVVRVPPPGARPVGPADVLRQGRIMAALAAADLPAPPVLAMRPGEATASGRPFVLLGFVRGEPVEIAAVAERPESLLAAALEVLGGIRRLALEETGLGGEETRPPVWQVERWEPLMRRGPEDLTGGAEALADRLRRSAPAATEVRLVHGDYHFGNLLFAGRRVVAVLDWEIAELGPPEVDGACLCVTALRRAMPGFNPGGEVAIRVEDVVRAAGASYRNLWWFVAAGCYKYAAIVAYNLDLHLRGKRVDPVYEGLRNAIPAMISEGMRFTA